MAGMAWFPWAIHLDGHGITAGKRVGSLARAGAPDHHGRPEVHPQRHGRDSIALAAAAGAMALVAGAVAGAGRSGPLLPQATKPRVASTGSHHGYRRSRVGVAVFKMTSHAASASPARARSAGVGATGV